jgi:putative oxidoreductase
VLAAQLPLPAELVRQQRAGFCVVAAVLYHNPSDPAQMTNFLKNFAIAGGLLMLFTHGPAGPTFTIAP